MFLVDQLILLVGLLLLIGIVSSKLSTHLGLPVLVLFMLVGMLAGEQGVGGIAFDDFAAAHAVGSLALAIILFDGGLRTDTAAIRAAWKPALLLATLGVLITAVATGAVATLLFDMSPLTGMLLGSIVASTDAAAVFSVLHSRGVRLRTRLSALLELESGSNDPMAIFLTIAVIELISGRADAGGDLLQLFASQIGIGALVGMAVGLAAVRIVNRINLDAAGLYPVLVGALGFLAFGLAATLGGSGFLAIYLAGIVLGSGPLVFQRGTFLFFDGLAWVSQIIMFIVLGLLSTPTSVAAVAGEGLLVAGVLIFVARPLAVVPLLLPFRFGIREHVLVSWVGLKGAVPIILAIFPLLYGVPSGPLIFNIVFFVVLASAILQGGLLPRVAAWLGLQEPDTPAAPVGLELTALRQVNAEIVDYTVGRHSPAAGRDLTELAIPDGVVIALIARGQSVIPPRGGTTIEPGDHVYAVVRNDCRAEADRVFRAFPAPP